MDNDIVKKLWNLCNILRDDGISYHEYVTELTYILFLKIASEKELEEKIGIDEEYRWKELIKLDGIELRKKYREMLVELGSKDGDLGTVYRNAQTKIEEPTNLKKIFSEVNKINWYSLDKEAIGDLYEGLLEKNASEKKSGAGQYFTPRVLIDVIIKIMKPKLGEKIFDPAAGTFGFLIQANKYIKENNDYFSLENEEYNFQKYDAFSACELVADTYRLGVMNALLHEIGGKNFIQGDSLSETGKKLKDFDLILSNPPFGTKKGGERASRDDLMIDTSNKQLNFVQIIYNSLKKNGKARAAVIVPDNVLFETGAGTEVRKDLLNKCNLHTILRLPTGIFYAQGVKTNVLFFERGISDKDNTKFIWYYDLRSNMPNFGKTNPLTKEYFEEFEKTFNSEEEKEKIERWTKIFLDEIVKKDYSLDMGLLKVEENVEEFQNPIENTEECVEKLEEALDLLKEILKELELCGVKKDA